MPTLAELLERLKKDGVFRDQCRELYRRVAAGERHPTQPPLPPNVITLACQAMTILFNHVTTTRAEPSLPLAPYRLPPGPCCLPPDPEPRTPDS